MTWIIFSVLDVDIVKAGVGGVVGDVRPAEARRVVYLCGVLFLHVLQGSNRVVVSIAAELGDRHRAPSDSQARWVWVRVGIIVGRVTNGFPHHRCSCSQAHAQHCTGQREYWRNSCLRERFRCDVTEAVNDAIGLRIQQSFVALAVG